jgi:hypothetical protein
MGKQSDRRKFLKSSAALAGGLAAAAGRPAGAQMAMPEMYIKGDEELVARHVCLREGRAAFVELGFRRWLHLGPEHSRAARSGHSRCTGRRRDRSDATTQAVALDLPEPRPAGPGVRQQDRPAAFPLSVPRRPGVCPTGPWLSCGARVGRSATETCGSATTLAITRSPARVGCPFVDRGSQRAAQGGGPRAAAARRAGPAVPALDGRAGRGPGRQATTAATTSVRPTDLAIRCKAAPCRRSLRSL